MSYLNLFKLVAPYLYLFRTRSMSSNIRISRICQHCGKGFTAKTTVTKYCSDPCAKRAYKQKIKESKIERSKEETKEIIVNSFGNVKDKEYLSAKEVAFLLGCSKQAVYGMINSGRLIAGKISERRTVIKRSEVEKLYESSIPEKIFKVEPKKNVYKIEDCYTIAEAEAKSQMSSKALYDYIKRNDIPKIQKGKFVYVPKALIDPLSK